MHAHYATHMRTHTRSIPHCYHDHRRSPATAHFLSPSNTQALWRGALKKLTQPGEAMKMSAVCATPQHNPSHTVNPTAVKQCPVQHTAAVSFHPQDNASVNLKSVLKDSRSLPKHKVLGARVEPWSNTPREKTVRLRRKADHSSLVQLVQRSLLCNLQPKAF